MNLWECGHKGCKHTAVGVGGAVGLRAIGWYIKFTAAVDGSMLGPGVLCPLHSLETVACMRDHSKGAQCGTCASTVRAHRLQAGCVDSLDPEWLVKRVEEEAREASSSLAFTMG